MYIQVLHVAAVEVQVVVVRRIIVDTGQPTSSQLLSWTRFDASRGKQSTLNGTVLYLQISTIYKVQARNLDTKDHVEYLGT